eukprot:3292247-Rhodomonas_salina.1
MLSSTDTQPPGDRRVIARGCVRRARGLSHLTLTRPPSRPLSSCLLSASVRCAILTSGACALSAVKREGSSSTRQRICCSIGFGDCPQRSPSSHNCPALSRVTQGPVLTVLSSRTTPWLPC